jgi:hypothetical protein
MEQRQITKGSNETLPMQLHNWGGYTAPIYTVSDTFTASVYRGQDQPVLFTGVVTWNTTDPDTGAAQTGYDQGQIVVSLTAANTATLEPGGLYLLDVWHDQQTQRVALGELLVLPAPGAGTQTVTPYCTYQDMLNYANWLRNIHDPDTAQEGFYPQRLEARRWLDEVILGAYAGTGWVPFGDPGSSAYSWTGGGLGWQWAGTSDWLRTTLAGGGLILHPPIVRASAYKAIALTACGQLGVGQQYMIQGSMFDALADREILMTVAEIDTASPPTGRSGLAIPLNSVRVIC